MQPKALTERTLSIEALQAESATTFIVEGGMYRRLVTAFINMRSKGNHVRLVVTTPDGIRYVLTGVSVVKRDWNYAYRSSFERMMLAAADVMCMGLQMWPEIADV